MVQVLHQMPNIKDDNLLVGPENSDDAAVYRLDSERAIVQSADFFTPMVDDPYTFGMIAAANALSDIYAMGAKPLFALNLVAFPSQKLSQDILDEMLRGGIDKSSEAGIVIGGGHSIDDEEPKYGLSVTGIVHPDKITRNSTARPGDHLILTKPLGIGIITTAIKKGIASAAFTNEAIEWMLKLNDAASQAMIEVGVSAATDVTGFGLLGHLKEVLDGSGVGAEIFGSIVPVIEGTIDCLEKGAYPGGSKSNMEFVAPYVEWDDKISDATRKVLCDAQTSGGLLICVPHEKKDNLKESLDEKGVFNVEIGRILDDHSGRIKVVA